jgi:hypothetical protein
LSGRQFKELTQKIKHTAPQLRTIRTPKFKKRLVKELDKLKKKSPIPEVGEKLQEEMNVKYLHHFELAPFAKCEDPYLEYVKNKH